jgi:gamma-glutamyltranspeptidase/glutathione hydrolase
MGVKVVRQEKSNTPGEFCQMTTLISFARLRTLIAAVAAAQFVLAPAGNAASPAPAAAENGMVVTAQHLATGVGVDVLKRGGNAVDAAVALGYALAVVYPAAGNLGGGGFMTIQFADGRKTFLDFREKAPLAATANMYLDPANDVVPGLSTKGHLAVGVPGTIHGLEYARAKYGTMTLGDLVARSISLADEGFVLEQGDVDLLAVATDDFRKDMADVGRIFLNNGEPLSVGSRLVQKDLARTLREISAKGTDGFHKGWVAQALVSSSQAGKGIIAQADLDQYRTREMAPVECNYRGYGVVSAPPPSSGGTTNCQILTTLEGYPLRDMGYRSADAAHVQIEAMRHAYVDRNSYLGDPDFVQNPVERLTSKAYAEKIRTVIDPGKAGVSKDIKPGVQPHEGNNTTHYSIVDKAGNAVSVTYTLNDWFGARVIANGTGVLLNDEMDDFTVKLGVPNLYGFVQGQVNAIAPGKRPSHQ